MKVLCKLLLLLLILLPAAAVEAHISVPLTDSVIGFAAWEHEPPIVGERNTLTVQVLESGELVAVERLDLQAELVTGDVVKPLNVASTASYQVTFIPTATGEMGIRLTGTIDGQPVEALVAAEPVLPADVLQFPDVVLANDDLQRGLIAIETAQATDRQLATIGVALSALALICAVGALILTVRRRR